MWGEGAPPPRPSRMFAAQINCTGCHTQVTTQGGVSFLGQGTAKADPKACAACHDARYVPMVERWKAQGKTLAAEARRMAGEGARLGARAPKGAEAAQMVADLEFNAKFLENGHPVHNIEYAIKVVQGSAAILKKLGEAVGAKAAAEVQTPFAKTSFTYCAESCHSFIPRPEPFEWKGVDVPHTYHVKKAGLSCDMCHAEGKHKEMNLASPADCAGCHHTDAKADCARCHTRQAALYRGQGAREPGHVREARRHGRGSRMRSTATTRAKPDALKNVGKACAACHEAKYEKTLEDWKAKLKQERDLVSAAALQAGLGVENLKRQGGDAGSYATKLQAIQARLDFLDRARGVHNMVATQAEYDRAKKDLQSVLDAVSKAAPTPPAPKPGWEKKR